MEATYVVVGGGIAGFSCVESLAIMHPEEPVIFVSASAVIKAVTNIIPVTKLATEYKIEEKPFDYMSSIHPLLTVINDTVISINSHHHILTTNSGTIIKYKKLCLCTGASPKIVIPDNEYVLGIRDVDSAQELQSRLKLTKKIAVIGNGGIATEIIHELKGVQVVWIVKDKHISATFMDPGAAEFFKENLVETQKDKKLNQKLYKRIRYSAIEKCSSFLPGVALGPDWHNNINLCFNNCKEYKVDVEYNVEVKSVIYFGNESDDFKKEYGHWPIYLVLTNDKICGCDLIISATGVIPNSKTVALEDALEFNTASDGGIKVNWEMQTNIPDIYAAGDVCTADWEWSPHWMQMRLWVQARQMGSYAAKSMVNSVKGEVLLQDFCFELFTHVTNFFGYKVILLGLFNGQTLDNNYEIMLRVTRGEEYIKLILRDGRLQGAILIGETDLEEMCENLILNQIDITGCEEELLNPFIDAEDYFD